MLKGSLVVPNFCVKILETAKLIEFGSSFGTETFLHVLKRPSIAGNFDAKCRTLQLMPCISATRDQRINFL